MNGYCFLGRMGCGWSTQVAIRFVSSLAWQGFGQYTLICFLCAHWYGRGLVYTIRYKSSVLSGIRGFGSTIVGCIFSFRWHGRGLVNTLRDAFCVHAGMGLVCQHTLICIFSLHWNGRGLVNTSWDTYWVLGGKMHFVPSAMGKWLVNKWWDAFWYLVVIGGVLAKHVKIHFVISLAWGGFA